MTTLSARPSTLCSITPAGRWPSSPPTTDILWPDRRHRAFPQGRPRRLSTSVSGSGPFGPSCPGMAAITLSRIHGDRGGAREQRDTAGPADPERGGGRVRGQPTRVAAATGRTRRDVLPGPRRGRRGRGERGESGPGGPDRGRDRARDHGARADLYDRRNLRSAPEPGGDDSVRDPGPLPVAESTRLRPGAARRGGARRRAAPRFVRSRGTLRRD